MKNLQKTTLAFLFLFFLTIGYSSFAQTTTSLGLKAGLNLANFRGSDAKDFENRTAFNIGGVLNYSVAESVGLSFELDYSSQGATLDSDGLAGLGAGTYTYKLDYLRGSLLFNYYFGSNEMSVRPELFIGPYYGFLMNAESKFEDGDWNDNKDSYVSGDFGATFGAGLHLKVSEGIWLVPDVRYSYGLISIAEADDTSVHNGVLSVNLGLTFPLN